MILKKRGVLLVVLVLLLHSFLINSEESAQVFEYSNDIIKFEPSIGVLANDEDECDPEEVLCSFLPNDMCVEGNDKGLISVILIPNSVTVNVKLDETPNENNDNIDCEWDQELSEEECFIFVDEQDGNWDSCIGGGVSKGTILNQNNARILLDEDKQIHNIRSDDDSGEAFKNVFNCDYFRTTEATSAICADRTIYTKANGIPEIRKAWLICDETSKGKIIRLDNKEGGSEGVYQCQLIQDEYITEQGLVLPTNGRFTWVELGTPSCDQFNCDTNEDVCVQNGFDFIPDGGCCGNDEFDDLGNKGSKDDTNYICLKDEAEKVGGELPNLVRVAESENSESVGWYWVPATQTQPHILTIKKPNKEPYDVVSNNERWVECRSEDVNYQGDKGVSERLVESDELKEANRFYCYHEGDRWSWAES